MLGEQLKRRRTQAGLTQAQLAARAGVSRARISAIEAGRHLPRVDAALALARALGASPEALFGRGMAEPVDALSGLAPAPDAPVRVGFVGDLPVTAGPRLADGGWDGIDGRAGDLPLEGLASRGAGAVVAGCEPALGLLERLLRERGSRAMAIPTSSAVALAALAAGRLHGAAVHFPRGAPPGLESVPVLRVGLARWRVGLAAPRHARRGWWQAALAGRGAVVQREPGAAAQQAFERALRARRRPVPGPRTTSHLAASRCALDRELPAVTIEPAAAAVGARFHALETHEVELWVRAEHAREPAVERLLELLGSLAYRRTLECIGGYDLSPAGSLV